MAEIQPWLPLTAFDFVSAFTYALTMGKLQRFRKQKDYSIRGLAKRAGLHWTTVWEVEAGRRTATVATLKKLAKALGVKVADLI